MPHATAHIVYTHGVACSSIDLRVNRGVKVAKIINQKIHSRNLRSNPYSKAYAYMYTQADSRVEQLRMCTTTIRSCNIFGGNGIINVVVKFRSIGGWSCDTRNIQKYL